MKKHCLFCFLALCMFLSIVPVSATVPLDHDAYVDRFVEVSQGVPLDATGTQNSALAVNNPRPRYVEFEIEVIIWYMVPEPYRIPNLISHVVLAVDAYPATVEILRDGHVWKTLHTEKDRDRIILTFPDDGTFEGDFYVRLVSVQGQVVDQEPVEMRIISGSSTIFVGRVGIERDAIRYRGLWWTTCMLPDHVRPPAANSAPSVTNVTPPTTDGILLNNQPLILDVPPQIINSLMMVPIRGIGEAMGAEFDWDDNTRTATMTRGETIVLIQVDNPIARVIMNGVEASHELATPATLMDGRVLVHARFVAEIFDAHVEWDDVNRNAVITTE